MLSATEQSTSEPESEIEKEVRKWQGCMYVVVHAAIAQMWEIASNSSRLPEWMPMIDHCETLEGADGIPGHRRRVTGDLFPGFKDGKSWAVETLLEFDAQDHIYTYSMDEGNMGMDNYKATFQLVDYGEDNTLVSWTFEVNPMEDNSEDQFLDYMEMFYKASIKRLELAASKKCIEAASI